MKILNNLKQNTLVGLSVGALLSLAACGETESTPAIDYTDKTLINSEKLLDMSGTYIMDASAKTAFKDSLGGGKLPSPHEGQVMTLVFDDQGSLNVMNSSGGETLIDCFVDYEITEGGVNLNNLWIPNGDVECPDPTITGLEMELTENYLLIQGAQFINHGYSASTTDYVMVFSRPEAVQ